MENESTTRLLDDLIGLDEELEYNEEAFEKFDIFDQKKDDVDHVEEMEDTDELDENNIESSQKSNVRSTRYTITKSNEEKSKHLYAASLLLKNISSTHPPYIDLTKPYSIGDFIQRLQLYQLSKQT